MSDRDKTNGTTETEGQVQDRSDAQPTAGRQITGLTPRTGEPNVTALRRGGRGGRARRSVDADPTAPEEASRSTPPPTSEERAGMHHVDTGPDATGAAPAPLGGDSDPAPERLRAVPADPVPSTATASESTTSPKAAVTFYINRQLRDRARAAYRATAHLHDDTSWSAFVERAVDELTQRRELEHNDAQPYTPDSRALSPGRPISDDA